MSIICSYYSLHSSEKALHKMLEAGYRDLLPFIHRSVCDMCKRVFHIETEKGLSFKVFIYLMM